VAKIFPDAGYYARVADATDFPVGPLETVFRLLDFLASVDPAVMARFALRGGTALNLAHLDMPRLSVDVDLDYVGASDAKTAATERPGILASLRTAAHVAGYGVVEERLSYALAHLRLGYRDAQGRPASIKVDVNFLDRVPILPPVRAELRHPFSDDLAPLMLQTLDLPELAATKTVALARRQAPRDLFDIALLVQRDAAPWSLVRTLVVVRGAAYPPPSPAEYQAAAVDRVSTAAWRSEVVSLARRPLPVQIEEARAIGRGHLEQVASLEDSHLRFLRLLDQGHLRPELLELDEGSRERVRRNPGLLWRLRTGPMGLEER